MAILKTPPISSSLLPWRIEDPDLCDPGPPLLRWWWRLVLRGDADGMTRVILNSWCSKWNVSETYNLVSQSGFTNSFLSTFPLLMTRLGDRG